jgi:cytochrome c oxidase subunit 4
MLVILFFMHLLWEANWKYVLTIPAAGMSVFLVCMLIPDIGLRVTKYSEERQTYAVERPVSEHNASHGSDHSAPAKGADNHDTNHH